MNLARMAARRATCPRRAVGAVLVKDSRVISTGYNGSPPGLTHCFGDGCKNIHGNCINTIHAEANALLNARDIGDTFYCTDQPCINCFKSALSHNPKITFLCLRVYKDMDRDIFVVNHDLSSKIRMVSPELLLEMIENLPPMPGEKI